MGDKEKTPSTSGIEVTLCALVGCDTPITPRVGGRPRLYCSDAHRAEAHRRRVRQVPDTESLLRQALSSLEAPEPPGKKDAALAAVRAEMAEALAAAALESAEALARAEEAEAALAERYEQIEAMTDELAQARGALEATREELAQAIQEAANERHALTARREEDLALVRAAHANARESWEEERQVLQERHEATRYELAEVSVKKDALAGEAQALRAEVTDLRATIVEVSGERDELTGALRVGAEQIQRIETELSDTRTALYAAEEARVKAEARAQAERERSADLVAEAAQRDRALGEINAEMGVLREALAGERAGREAAEHKVDQMSERVVAELVAVRELVEKGSKAGRRGT